MKYSRSAMGFLTAQYRNILKKCILINMGFFALGAVLTPANAARSGGVIGTGEGEIASPINNQNYSNGSIEGSAGAIYNRTSGAEINNTTFSSNSAIWGGAIGNYGENASLTINNSTFSLNTASSTGSAIDNDEGAMLNINGSTFLNNTATDGWGAVISSFGTLNIDNSTFDGNSSFNAGVVLDYVKSPGAVNISNSIIKNTTVNEVGAVALYSKFGESKISNTQFIDNKATYNGGYDILNMGGAAVSLGAESKVTIENSTFTHNTTDKLEGGAIGTRKGAPAADNSGAKLDILSSTFTNNSSNTDGGAIENHFYNSNKNAGSITIDTATFTSNTSGRNGGAVYNSGNVDIAGKSGSITMSNSNFTSNVAAGDGGAIWNAGQITFTGTNVFSENSDSTGLNDIYNSGTITFTGDVSLDGGISGDGSTTFAKDSNVTVIANKTKIANNVINNGATLKINLDDSYTGSYVLVNGTLDKEFTIAENSLYNIISDESVYGKYEISKKSNEEISNSINATANEAAVLNTVTDNMHTGNELFDSIAQNMNNIVQSDSAEKVEEAKDAAIALAPETAPALQQVTTQTANQVFGAVGTRLSGGSVVGNNRGISSGDALNGVALWVQGMINHAKYDSNKHSKGFDSDTKGVALGIEKQFNRSVKAGIGYAYSKTDIDGFMRDTDVKTNTAIVYGEYKPSQWYANAVASYSWSKYKEDKKVTGVTVKSKYDTEAFALQAMTGYDIYSSFAKITPEVGLRYIHIDSDNYTDKAGQHVKNKDSNVVTGVMGTKIAKTYRTFNGVLLTPEVKAAMTYDISHDNSKSTVSLANGSSYSVSGKPLNRFGVEVGAGLTAELNNSMELALGYEGKFRKDYQDHTGLISAKYKF